MFLLPAFLAPGAAAGQVTVLAIEFSFSHPGARSMGFGGAFAGLADDATAAFANPAGLIQLVEPEVSVEGRIWNYATPFTEGGRIFGEPTGIGLDTTSGLRMAESRQTIDGLSFFSFVYPKSRWSLAIYRHQLANFEFFGETQGLFRGVPEGPPGARERFPELRAFSEFEIVSHGLSVAYRLTERLSLGLGFAYFDGTLHAASESYRPPNISDPNLFLPEALELVSDFSIDSADQGFSAGILWQIAERWRLGGFFREGPRFELTAEFRAGPAVYPPAPAGTLLLSVSTPVAMPDVFGLGLSFQSRGGALTLGLEWDRVEYASIVDSLDPTAIPATSVLDDVDEIHLGAEYAFVRSTPLVALRAGVWLEPDHRLRASAEADLFERAVRQPGDDEIHWAAGVGVSLKAIQVDLAVDFSELVDSASLSAIYSF